MAVTARRVIQRLRGGSRAHLIEADDGHHYVVKGANNPQGGRRILINEWLGAMILSQLGIASCRAEIISVGKTLFEDTASSSMGSSAAAVIPEGLHFASRHPGPSRGVFDFIPDSLLQALENRRDFIGVLAVDKWAGNVDARQAVFLRGRVRHYAPALDVHPLRVGWVSLMIDNGYLFDGPQWDFPDAAEHGMYFRPSVVYRGVQGIDSFQPWLDRIMAFSYDAFDEALSQLPPSWFEGDDMGRLENLCERLMARRRRVPDLLLACARAHCNPFPDWRAGSAVMK